MTEANRISSLRSVVDLDALRQAFLTGTGRGVRAVVIDSGVDGSHPAFAGKLKSFHEVRGDGYAARCWPASPTDSIGHGTATAGIVLQVAPEVELHAIKVLGDDAHGTAAQLAAALEFAIDQKFDVINMSLGTTQLNKADAIIRLVERAFHEGGVIVAAANNFGLSAYPANLPSVIGVNMEGFEDVADLRYDWGKIIELSARGVYVEAPAMGGGTELFTGTSFACPNVSGLLARLFSVFPGLSQFEARFALSMLASTQAHA
jgi:subtilisin family serine protease